jgi:hypothetical protein
LVRLYIEIDGRNDFNAIPIRLNVELFYSLGANDGLGHEIVLQKKQGLRSKVSGLRNILA